MQFKINTAVLQSKHQLTPNILQATFSLPAQATINFEAGQFISVRVTPTAFRAYSLASSPLETHGFSLCVEVGHDGVGSNFFKNLDIGHKIDFVGPAGRFVLPSAFETQYEGLVFLCVGSGAAPFIAMLSYLNSQGYKNHISFIFGTSKRDNVFVRPYLLEASKALKLNVTYCLSQEDTLADSNEYLGRVTSYLTSKPNLLAANLSSLFLLCGNPDMVHDTYQLLLANGIKPAQILTELFTRTKV